ncbi:MAG: GspE/PulE family protein [Alphaproteobacteria bacterium]
MVAKSHLTIDQKLIVQQEVRAKKVDVKKLLIELGFITEKTLAACVAEINGIQPICLESTIVDQAALEHCPKDFALRHRLIPISLNGSRLHIAMVDANDIIATDNLQRLFPQITQIEKSTCSESDLHKAIETHYGHDTSLEGIFADIEHGPTDDLTPPIIRLVNSVISKAVHLGASDIHFQPEKEYVRLRFRIDGVLSQVSLFHKSYWSPICVRLKIMAGLNIAENRKPQNGRFSLQVSAREVDFRVSVHPTVYGENVVLRILDKSHSLKPLEGLGFQEEIVSKVKTLIKKPHGIFVLTGPTGSGKTTTMYSIISYLNTMDVNIMTLEDPVEYRLPMIRQTAIKEMAGTTFADGVRSLLRQDPDVIFIGEIRDEATAQMALRASMTGHQVFTTLHTNDTFGILGRLEDLGVSRLQIADQLSGAVSQRLVRKLCSSCKTGRPATSQEKHLLNCKTDTIIYEPTGCDKCRQTGFNGRQAIVELLSFNQKLKDLVAEGAPLSIIRNAALTDGMQTLPESAAQAVLSGVTSLEEATRTIDLQTT